MYYCNCFGDATLTAIVSTFEKSCNIEIKNFSHYFGRIRIRKGDRCTFLKKLLLGLENKMEQLDE